MRDFVSGARGDVLEFYKELPFNASGTPDMAAQIIKKTNAVKCIYPYEDDFTLESDVLEMGCGTGWLANTIAYYYGSKVTAVDFNTTAINFARQVTDCLKADVNFVCEDLFRYEGSKADVVISNGVLHHTDNVRGGVERCAALTKSGGKIFIGLYHKYGRKPFLDYFKKLKAENADEEFLFRKYKELDSRHKDEKQARSWFMDQVMHPYESQHTLREVTEIFNRCDVRLVSTSINRFQKWSSLDELYDFEEKLYEVGMKFLSDKRYYPGFFYVIGVKER